MQNAGDLCLNSGEKPFQPLGIFDIILQPWDPFYGSPAASRLRSTREQGRVGSFMARRFSTTLCSFPSADDDTALSKVTFRSHYYHLQVESGNTIRYVIYRRNNKKERTSIWHFFSFVLFSTYVPTDV